jgi:V8-like Glu-specific endopeptidase
MTRTLKMLLTLAVIFPALSAAAFAETGKSIYGPDNRIELFNAAPDTFKLADSVVSLWDAGKVKADAGGKTFTLTTENFGTRLNLCSGEKFREQPMGAFCSGSLVGPDLVMTAGHCITDESKCQGTKIVFGFALKKAGGTATTTMGQSEVYTCKKIVKRFLGGEPGSSNPAGQNLGPDYALIQLDRKVTGHTPLPVSRTDVKKGDKLMVIGHPVGLPLKIAAGASVRDASKVGYFVADLDTFGGNSGSPVFDTATKLITGILVRGDEDFKQSPEGCTTMATYAQTGGRGEDVTKISALQSFIPKLGASGKAAEETFKDMSLDSVSPGEITQPINLSFQ